jgi:hypothetical protein
MKFLKNLTKWLISLLVFTFIIWLFVFNWSFLFKTRIVGEISTVEKVNAGLIVNTGVSNTIPAEAFSFSIAIKDLHTGEIHMASSEDRKWAATQKGNCVIAAFFPYPPWNLSKGTTDFNARLLQNFQSCEMINKEESVWDKIKFFFLWA